MGVSGLWELIKDAGQQRSLAHLAVKDGFEDNTSSKRAYRIGIDVSIWLTHSYSSKGGENPQLRLLFFRLANLATLPLIPLFVFDGRKRPKIKRGSKKGKSGSHPLSRLFKEMIEAFGMEYREAMGEAEAELAYLNSKGYIDAILTDDCDALVFGGRTIIRNWSSTLSGNRSDAAAQQNSGSSSSKNPQVTVYSADRIHGLTRGGLILYALLNGGDYDNGVHGFGHVHSLGLAKCGFGDSLLREYQAKGQHILPFLARWREEMNTELATNSRGFLPGSKHRIPNSFPNLEILEFYANPISSGGGPVLDNREMNLRKLVGFCEAHFEWAWGDNLVKRFRDLVWDGAVMHVLRRAALEADAKEREKRAGSGNEDRVVRGALTPSRAEGVGTSAALVRQYLAPIDKPSKEARLARIAGAFENRPQQASQAPLRREEIPDPYPLISRIVSTRRHVSTGNLFEYRVEVCPVQLVRMTREAIRGLQEPPEPTKPTKKPPPEPDSVMRMWVPGSILHQVHPGLVEDYALTEEARMNRGPGGRGKRRAAELEDDADEEREASSSQPVRRRQHAPAPPPPARRTQLTLAAVPPPTLENNAVMDPWFAAGDDTRNHRFLFTFANPDEPDFDEDPENGEGRSTPVVPSVHRDVGWNENPPYAEDDDDMAVDLPPDPLDAMWDQIIDGRTKTKHKAKARRKPRNGAAPSTRIRRKDDLLTRLDKLDARRAGAMKRRRVDEGEGGMEVGMGGVLAFPAMPALGRMVPAPRRAPWQLEPTSSQDSLLSQNEDFMDLTL